MNNRKIASLLRQLANEFDQQTTTRGVRDPRPGTKAEKALRLLTRPNGALISTIRRIRPGTHVAAMCNRYGYTVRKVKRGRRVRYYASA